MNTARKWGPWALLLVVAVAVLAAGLQRGGGRPSLDARVQHIAGEVRCPVCHGETVAQSGAAPSVEIRTEIRADLLRGRSERQILDSIVASYGPGILEKPQTKGISLLVWVLPVAAVVLAAVGLLLAFRRWRVAGEPGSDAAGVPAEVVADPARARSAAGAAGAAGVAGAVGSPALGADPAGGSGRWVSSRRTRALVACAGAVLVAGGTTWAVAASSSSRLPGQEITGKSLGPEELAASLQAAHADENKNDVVDAIKQYQKVLASDPNQVEALTGEGWLLAETGQPALLKQGLTLLTTAEKVQPNYGPAHVDRGLALLGEGDYANCVPELQWYLDHSPDRALVPGVQKALALAKSKAAAESTPATGSK